MTIDEMLILAETATTEDERLDFKSEFAPDLKKAFWVEIVKDIVAFANTVGGAIVFGVNDDGSISNTDCSELISFDPAKITDQVALYTGTQFSKFMITTVARNGVNVPVIVVEPTRIPMVFKKPGTYETEPGKQKTSFSLGTVYFRHGAKSEPATQDDLRASFDRELARIREEWLSNMRTIVEAPPGSTVTLVAPLEPMSNLRLSSDPTATAITVRSLYETHPYTQSEVIKQVKQRTPTLVKFNSHDVQSIKAKENVDHITRPDMVHKPHAQSSPQYSEAFVEMICIAIDQDSDYLVICRQFHKSLRYPTA
ncbi:MAG: putative DNA binding domain-containing protein [Roseicyclus sp.]